MSTPKVLEKFETLCNRLLADDPESLDRLSELAGRIITVETFQSGIVIHLQIHDHGIHFLDNFEGKSDVKIRASLPAFMQLLVNRGKSINASTPDMEVSGDIGFAQQLQSILSGLEIDWEEYLSQWIGDTPAHKLMRIAKQTREALVYSGSRLGMNVSEYLRYEKRWFPVQPEIDEFVEKVDELRNDVERFRQRIDRVEQVILKGSND